MDPTSAKQRMRSLRRRALERASRVAGVTLVLGLPCVLGVPGALELSSPSSAQDKPAKPAAQASGETPDSHAVAEGDTLWDLSGHYFKSSYEWPRLWSYNPEITNPHWIYPGHMLRLREGADGGYAGAAPAGGGPLVKSRFGGGFGAALVQRPSGAVILGEQIYLDRDALDSAALIVGSTQDKVMLTQTDEIYLKYAKGEGPIAGKELSVFVRLDRAEVAPKAGKVRVYKAASDGEIVRVLGAIPIQEYDEEKRIARAVITEALDPIERGFEVTDVPRRLAQVAPKTNGRKVESTIVAAGRPLGTLAQNQVVFIGAGSKEGVEVGNRFSVVRRGDPWRDSLKLKQEYTGASRMVDHPPASKDYPQDVVAEIRVIYVRPESCTGLITASKVEVTQGDHVEMREGY